MARACKACKALIESGSKCLQCGSEEVTENFKGKVIVLNEEQSEIAKNLKVKKKGTYAVKLG